jgi:4-hydroxy-3-methylbut-2-enyl diphosphate reductase
MKKNLSIFLAAPRGFCAGVERAIEVVEIALEKWGAPIYVRHEIVHNKFVVDNLRTKGAIFIHEVSECPEDRPIIFSAHGVAKSVISEAQKKNITYIDATCPLVTKVHVEAERNSKKGFQTIMIGHKGHPETVGTMGQVPVNDIILVETVTDVAKIKPKSKNKLAFITQTTLSVDDTADIVKALKGRFPEIIGPHKEDICYATTNRQSAVKKIAPKIEALLVVGSNNSSNSRRLVEVGKKAGCKYAQLIQDETNIDWRALDGIKSIGITAGASAPEVLINRVINAFQFKFNVTLKTIEITKENVSFKVPKALRKTTT